MNKHDPAEEIAALRAELAQFRLLADNVPAAIAYYERHGLTCRFANRGYARMFGHTVDSIVGLTFAQVIGEEAARAIQPQVDGMLTEGRASSYERQLRAPDGSARYIEVNLLPHLDDAGRTVGAFVLISDITRHRTAELALRESEERLAKFLHANAEGIVFHRDGVITDANPPLLALVGHTLEQMRGRPALDFVAPDQRERVGAVMRAGAELTYETAVLHANGERLPVEFIVRTMQYADERLRMTIVRDLRDRLAARARIDYLAHHDPLTGLPNRAAFLERAHERLGLAAAADDGPALLFVDLDHFKRVNDSLGHAAGDALLRTVAERLTACLRADDLVARYGGDEFVILLSGHTPESALGDVARKLLAAVGAPLQLGGALISVTPSIGIARFPRDGRTPDELIQRADLAMYEAKAHGRAGWHFFEPVMADAAQARLSIEGLLAQALREQAFVLHYQPLLRVDDGTPVACEALIRWNRPGRGLVLPDAFVPVAEGCRLMLPIGQWVLREAVREALRWRAASHEQLRVAVNLAPSQLLAPDFVPALQQLLREEGADGSLLEVEVGERLLTDGHAAELDTLRRLRDLGVRVSIDDFGTGTTSLARLRGAPIDRLKVDRTFVQALPQDDGVAALAQTVIRLARELGLQAVAEGVETAEQRDWLAAQGCQLMQGHLFARPLPADELRRWLDATRGAAGAAATPSSP